MVKRLTIAAWLKEAAAAASAELHADDSVESFLPLVDEAIRRAELSQTAASQSDPPPDLNPANPPH